MSYSKIFYVKTLNVTFKPIVYKSYQIVIQQNNKDKLVLNDIFKCISSIKYSNNRDLNLIRYNLFSHFSGNYITSLTTEYNNVISFECFGPNDDILKLTNIMDNEVINDYNADHVFYYNSIKLKLK